MMIAIPKMTRERRSRLRYQLFFLSYIYIYIVCVRVIYYLFWGAVLMLLLCVLLEPEHIHAIDADEHQNKKGIKFTVIRLPGNNGTTGHPKPPHCPR